MSKLGRSSRLTHVAAALALVTLTGAATAASDPLDESMATLDLQSIMGSIFFLKCESGATLLDCKVPTVWEQSNDYPGLQTRNQAINGERYAPDFPLLG